MNTITTPSIPIKSWAVNLDPTVLKQAQNLANLPSSFHHIVLNADCHVGNSMPIGAVLACRDIIVPNAVGSDIGCSILAYKLSIYEISRNALEKVYKKI
jgi:tRNA-splicing ligase RtcB